MVMILDSLLWVCFVKAPVFIILSVWMSVQVLAKPGEKIAGNIARSSFGEGYEGGFIGYSNIILTRSPANIILIIKENKVLFLSCRTSRTDISIYVSDFMYF